MCGRYALALRPSQIRRILEDDDLPVADAPDDEASDAPRQSYNFAPGYHGIVYRAVTPDRGAVSGQEDVRLKVEGAGEGPTDSDVTSSPKAIYKLQSMRWGLIPSWTKRNPDYASMLRTINCRSDSLSTSGGMWGSMKARKRCVVIAQGFFEWLSTGPKNKLPHYVKRKDGQLMCFAGLWDCVRYEGTENTIYTYTIVTTDSNKQLKFIHDRMPVIFNPDSDKLRKWVDPSRYQWSQDLQSLLTPFDGELEVYPVKQEVGKVGNNSPTFIIPLDSEENKSSIAHFFSNAPGKHFEKGITGKVDSLHSNSVNIDLTGNASPSEDTDTQVTSARIGEKRKISLREKADLPLKKRASTQAVTISATRNKLKSPAKPEPIGSQKITNFFTRSS
ncbi:Abasic site processing protein [Cladobotryum mycophilum]|uniref:Abasic site processing protein n=1 Tax=Cladobotryum mycophilum TaxID=491253 RepID=A0ABR0SGN6_9HYPO